MKVHIILNNNTSINIININEEVYFKFCDKICPKPKIIPIILGVQSNHNRSSTNILHKERNFMMNLRNKKFIFFDMDGILIDTEGL